MSIAVQNGKITEVTEGAIAGAQATETVDAGAPQVGTCHIDRAKAKKAGSIEGDIALAAHIAVQRQFPLEVF